MERERSGNHKAEGRVCGDIKPVLIFVDANVGMSSIIHWFDHSHSRHPLMNSDEVRSKSTLILLLKFQCLS